MITLDLIKYLRIKHEQQGQNGELITVIPRRNSFNVRSNTEESVKNLIKLTNDYITQNNLVPKPNLNNIGINKGKIKAKMGSSNSNSVVINSYDNSKFS